MSSKTSTVAHLYESSAPTPPPSVATELVASTGSGTSAPTSDPTTQTTKSIASEAYIYFYPIVENLKTLFFSGVWPNTSSFIGVNVFEHVTYLLDYTFTDIVSPNNDTLYSQAWLDLEQTPIVLSLPDVADNRYYSMQLVNGYTFNFQTISPRTTGSWKADKFLIVGPNYKGTTGNFAPSHVFRSTSRFNFLLGRTAVYGPDDLDNVIAIQQQYSITYFDGAPLQTTQTALPDFPFIDRDALLKPSPEPQLFFTYANFIMQYINIASYEDTLFANFRTLDIGPGLKFDGQNMGSDKYADIVSGVADGRRKIDIGPIYDNFGNFGNGWVAFIEPTIFGTEEEMKEEYIKRAFAAKIGLYGNDPAEATYPLSITDSDSDAFDAEANNYTLTFKESELPPMEIGGFWSLTMYRLPDKLFVHNPIDRYSISDRTPGLVYGDDGSLTIYIQKDEPASVSPAVAAAAKANWLPAPRAGDPYYGDYASGQFNVMLRVYWPTEDSISLPPYLPPTIQKNGVPPQ